MALDRKPLLTIAATFTAEPIEDSIVFWLRKFDVAFDIRFAPYNQVFQELIGGDTLPGKNEDGVNLLLVRLEDWQGGHAGSVALPSARIEQNARDFIDALAAASMRSAAPYVVCLCAASPAATADVERAAAIARAEERIEAAFKDAPTVHVVGSRELAEIYRVDDYYAEETDRIGHVPYTANYFTALGTMASRRIWALKSRPYKVIALDCDGTLWKGTCGEDGADGVEFGAPWRSLQEFMVRQVEAGMLLCICSKNSPEDVFAVFDRRRDEMPLRREHIVSWRVNWTAKSENLRSLAAELDLGLDSVIMVDDNPIECAEVEANSPEALALQLPTEEARIPTFLRRIWAFDHLKVTGEDKNRTEYYRANAERETVRTASSTMDDFLRGLDLQIAIAPVQSSQIERVAQLTQRTNQFNVSGIRRTASDVRQLLERGDAHCLAVHVRDRFGDYGLVGVIVYVAAPDAIVVDSFMLSCRALGRRVEHRMLSELGAVAKKLRADHVEVPFSPSAKNRPARDFLESFGKPPKGSDDGRLVYQVTADFAACVSEAPATRRAAVEHLEDGATP